MYAHLEKLHGVTRPSGDVILIGFNLGPEPKAVFGQKAATKKFKKVSKKPNKRFVVPLNTSTPMKIKTESSSSSSSVKIEEVTPSTSTSADDSVVIILSSGESSDEEQINPNIEMITPILRRTHGKRKIMSQDLESTRDEASSSRSNPFSSPANSPLPKLEHSSPKSEPFSIHEEDFQDLDLNSSQVSNYENSDTDETEDIDDSDTESIDDEEFTTRRLMNKRLRHAKRMESIIKPSERPENERFIRDMEEFMKLQSVSTSSSETTAKDLRHLFFKDDSFLQFELSKNKNFKLENLRSFNDDTFQHLQYPLSWLVTTCDSDGTKATERLKAHSDLRQYILYEVDRFSSSMDFADKKQAVQSNLESISKQISSAKLWNRYNKMANNSRQTKERAELILEPSKNYNINNCVRLWNSSAEKSEEDLDHQFLYETCMKSKHITPKQLTKYASYARMSLCLSDKSRQSAYKFRFKDYLEKLEQFYPENYTSFNKLPDGWNPNSPPFVGAEPSVWIIYVPGKYICKHLNNKRLLIFQKVGPMLDSTFLNINKMELLQSQAPANRELLRNSTDIT